MAEKTQMSDPLTHIIAASISLWLIFFVILELGKGAMMKTGLKVLGLAVPGWLATSTWAEVLAQGGTRNGEGYMYYGHPHMWGGDWGWGGMFLGPLFGLLFIAAVAVAIVFVVRAVSGDSGHAPRSGRSSALDILDERFARGEIDKDEYEDRKRSLSGN